MAATALLGIAVVAGGTIAGCKPRGMQQQANAAMQRPPAPVGVAQATARDVPIYLEEIGRTSAIETVDVKPQVSGRIVKIDFKDGQDVKEKGPLFTIDLRWFEADVAQAQATVAQRTAELALANQEFARVGPLLEKKAISQQEYDTKKSQVAVAEAVMQAAESAVETTKLNLEYAQIKSPIGGRVGQHLVDIGNVVKANETTLVTIQRLDPIYVDFTTSERNLPSVRQHMQAGTLRVEVRVPGDDGPPGTGELTFLDTSVQPGTGTIKLRATLENKDRRFWAGQFVEIRLILEVKKDAVLIPSPAVQIGQQGPFVYVVKGDQTAEIRPIRQGQRQGGLVVINSGVSTGERVIISGHMAVMPGAKVNPLPAAPTSPGEQGGGNGGAEARAENGGEATAAGTAGAAATKGTDAR
jgi:multidrug efflux system membrane fusion protein